MSLVVRVPADDPSTWLGPEWTVYHWQEDNLSDWNDYAAHGLSVNTAGNGFCAKGDIVPQDIYTVEHAFKLFDPGNFTGDVFKIACAVHLTKPSFTEVAAGLIEMNLDDLTQVRYFGNISILGAGVATRTIDDNISATVVGATERTSSLGVLDYNASLPAPQIQANIPQSVFFDGCNTKLYLKIEFLPATTEAERASRYYYSTDGTGWNEWLHESQRPGTNCLGFGFFAGSGLSATNIDIIGGSGALNFGVSFDWVAHGPNFK
jgi:hypothetical protein